MTEYKFLRKDKNVVDYSLSFNRDSALSEVFADIEKKEFLFYLNKYPDSGNYQLSELIKVKYGIDNVIVGSGSEDLIVRINKLLLKDLKVAVIAPIFYRIYETLDNPPIFVNIPTLKGSLYLDVDYLMDIINTMDISAIWISNPNSIYGNAFTRGALLNLIKAHPDILFLIDEVSIDFTIAPEKLELFQVAEKLDNLIVIKSVSKYYGFPGMRLGYATGHRKYIDKLLIQSQVYPVNNLDVLLFQKIIQKERLFIELKSKIHENKKKLKRLVEGTPITIIDSLTNTFVLKLEREDIDLWEKLKEYNMLTCSLANEKFVKDKNCVRITIHSGEDFDILYDNVKKIIDGDFNEDGKKIICM